MTDLRRKCGGELSRLDLNGLALGGKDSSSNSSSLSNSSQLGGGGEEENAAAADSILECHELQSEYNHFLDSSIFWLDGVGVCIVGKNTEGERRNGAFTLE